MCGGVEVRVRSEGGDEDLEGSLVLLVDVSRPLFGALYVLYPPSALVSSFLDSSAGNAIEIVLIGGKGC